MKFKVFFAASVLAFGISQAAAQDSDAARTRHAAASPAHDTDAAPAPAPDAKPASDAATARPASDARPAPRAARRPAARRPQEQPQGQGFWANFFRGNAMGGPADPRAARPQAPAGQSYAARPPSNRLFLGMFYTVVPRETVAFRENYAPGTIIVRQRERRLYYVLGNGQALRYAVAVGREGAAWAGVSTVSNKREWPSWTPTPEILRRQPNLPRFMEGGPQNPMGARALYLGDTLYRIHGTNEPWMIGEEASSGCIRMTNDDVIDLYNRTRLGATVIVQR
jgi:lipoprotein-anchoring transpeptidase ErfK/SrfK